MAPERRAVFLGVARDCAPHLPGVLENVGRFAATYEAAAFCFVVSDTSDGTVPLLEAWLSSGRRPGRVIDLGELSARLPLRTERIARARNTALDAIEASPWSAFDDLVVVDLDNVLGAPIDVGSFLQAKRWLAGEPLRGGVFASATPRYYDIWALRHEHWCPSDCWHAIWERSEGEAFEAAKFREVFARQIALPVHLPPIEVRSAFGGLAIYRLPLALAARYCGLDARERQVSEHVAFNAALTALGARLHVFPALRVKAPPEHLYQPADFRLRWRAAMAGRRAIELVRPSWRPILGTP
ncbi:MAG: hypothetical protein ACOY4R_07520 [Pseudomonadota bacterium]